MTKALAGLIKAPVSATDAILSDQVQAAQDWPTDLPVYVDIDVCDLPPLMAAGQALPPGTGADCPHYVWVVEHSRTWGGETMPRWVVLHAATDSDEI